MPDYRIFVSYSRTDAWIVLPLVELLRVTGDSIFRDADGIPPGSRWRAVLTAAIDGCETFLLFWCCHSSASPEVKKEFDQAIEGKKTIVPVLMDETPLTPELAEFQAIDVQGVMGGHAVPALGSKARMPDLYRIGLFMRDKLGKILNVGGSD
jgi:hypothetical protein